MQMKTSQYDGDVIVIGTGIGGGTAGYALARAGRRVLFLEKGLHHRSPSATPIWEFPEVYFKSVQPAGAEHRELLQRAGRLSDPIGDQTNGTLKEFIPILGSGLGGSSSLYGAAMERFYPEDFKVTSFFQNENDKDAALVDWPLGYKDLEPFYEEAEKLYEVYGAPDPLRLEFQSQSLPQIPLTAIGQELFNHLQKKGLHPYRLPTAHRKRQKCSGCQGTLCSSAEKGGSGERCVIPALQSYGAELLDRCEVVELHATPHRIESVRVIHQGKILTLRANLFILGAGAFETPKLLLRSKSSFWPDGIGNHFDQVGRYLMRHYMDLHIVLADVARKKGFLAEKELAFNDFYIHEGHKFGTVQSLGNFPNIQASLCEQLTETLGRHHYLNNLYLYWQTMGMKFLFPRSVGFATIMEDVPLRKNRLWISDDAHPKLRFQYSISASERRRIRKFRKLVSRCFSPYWSWFHGQAENNQRLAHACGTCRMGKQPEFSVVDAWNKVHGMDNLFIVDASVFPTGSGINPALTIAALALRTTAGILGTLS